MLDEEEFKIFKAELDSADSKAWTEWGRKMQELNIGNHRLGSDAYRGKHPIWDKEDQEMECLGKENMWNKFTDLQLMQFVRARYYLDLLTKEFVTDHQDVKDFKEELVRNLP